MIIGSWEIIGQFIGSSESGAETREEVLLDRQMEEASQSLLNVSGREYGAYGITKLLGWTDSRLAVKRALMKVIIEPFAVSAAVVSRCNASSFLFGTFWGV